ncbi:hypothetical protein N7492_005160 [Penicillium capsulatum]|uniref:Diaminohydroxyphosphoribosylamino-pyrimidine deaminase n=1 Tax=Penicillium capsulatum TaxID=69766 RepID=A0A9W9ICX2_9EURO|nr:hypothetical protein N7492_005160 [Penicillium capsulatum]
MASISDLLANGEEVIDAEEEAFLLFSQDIPTGNLGFLDSRAASVEVTIRDDEFAIHQSPTLLSSARAGGTTGAVLWKITPLFADWISSPSNPLWTHALLSPSSVVAELGCGISALVALALAPSVQHYIATDQEYVRRLFRTNLDANAGVVTSAPKQKEKSSKVKARSSKSTSKKTPSKSSDVSPTPNITFTTLDWELDEPRSLKSCIEAESSPREGHGRRERDQTDEDQDHGVDLLLSCDCIYNEALVAPFVRTSAEICRLRPAYNPSLDGTDGSVSGRPPTICIVAQQQRAPDVFETWLRETLREFRVWKLSDEVLGDGLKSGTGYLVHLLMVRERN